MIRQAGRLALVAIAALAVGCGGGNDDLDYVDQLDAFQADLVEQISEALSGPALSSPREASATAAALADVFARGAERIQAVTPPEEVEDLHASLVEEIDGIADQLAETADELRGADAEQASQAMLGLQEALATAQTKLQRLAARINAALGD